VRIRAAISGLNAISELTGRLIWIPFGISVMAAINQNGIDKMKSKRKNFKRDLSTKGMAATILIIDSEIKLLEVKLS
jgi:hypothetical protein